MTRRRLEKGKNKFWHVYVCTCGLEYFEKVKYLIHSTLGGMGWVISRVLINHSILKNVNNIPTDIIQQHSFLIYYVRFCEKNKVMGLEIIVY